MGKFTIISQEAFPQIQADAGVILNKFDPENPKAPADADIVTATTGGINVVCTPTYSDWGEDIDNVPDDMKEFKHLDGWECTFSFTALGTSPEAIRLVLGSADITGNKVAPRRDLKQTDFQIFGGSGTEQTADLLLFVLRMLFQQAVSVYKPPRTARVRFLLLSRVTFLSMIRMLCPWNSTRQNRKKKLLRWRSRRL